MTAAERDQAVRRFIRKVSTHALNALQETREEFVRKYLSKYHQKMQEQADLRANRAKSTQQAIANQTEIARQRTQNVKDEFGHIENI